MSIISLPALHADNPIGFLAALGTLRLLDDFRAEWQPRLCWVKRGRWIPALALKENVTLDEVCAVLANKIHSRAKAREFNWADVIATAPEVFRSEAQATLEVSSLFERESADFLAAFAAEGALSNKGDLKPTALCMTSGQMKFLKEARAIIGSLALAPKKGEPPLADRFRAALTGSWDYADDQHSLGWDPTNEPIHAMRAYDPSGQGKQTSVREAVYLALESLSLFPVFARASRLRTSSFQLHTTGFHLDERRQWFHWPIWGSPLSLRTVCSLLQLAELVTPSENWESLHTRGVRAVYRARRSEFGKGYGIFRPAELAAGA